MPPTHFAPTRKTRTPRRHARALLLVALATLAASCATVEVTRPAAEVPQEAPAQANQRVERWHFDAGNRPPAESDGYRPPTKLAVLLPLSGSLATAAGPVRDGLLSAYYGERRRRPELQFYDTNGTAGGATAAYAKAVADGADQVLGPLGRDEVDAVFRGAQPNVPVIALNRVATAPPTNSASFSLAPEDDGTGAAEYMLSRNAKRVLVLNGGDDYARRSAASFGKRLQEAGGTIVNTLYVAGDKPADMLPALQAAAQGEGGIDAVFLALRSAQARAVSPQLSAAGLSSKLRVGTSQLAASSGKTEADRVLDGVAFPTESWNVGSVPGLPSAASAEGTLPTARGAAGKLFAFGYDAWLLTAYLERLALREDGRVDGATGILRIDPQGNVVRTPAWSTFSNGVIVPLAGAGG